MKKISIEFLGMPGSGKTFYQKLIARKKIFKKFKIITNRFDILSRKKKFLLALAFIAKYPVFFFKTLFLIISNKEKKIYFYYFRNEIALWEHFDRFNKNCIFISSEGFNYRASHYFQENFNRKRLNNYLGNIPRTDIKILIDSSKKENISRANLRKKGYKYSKDDIENYEKKLNIINKIKFFYKKKNSKIFIFKNKKNNIKINLKNLTNYLK